MNDRDRSHGGVCANLFSVCTHKLLLCFVGHLYVVIPSEVLFIRTCLNVLYGLVSVQICRSRIELYVFRSYSNLEK